MSKELAAHLIWWKILKADLHARLGVFFHYRRQSFSQVLQSGLYITIMKFHKRLKDSSVYVCVCVRYAMMLMHQIQEIRGKFHLL